MTFSDEVRTGNVVAGFLSDDSKSWSNPKSKGGKGSGLEERSACRKFTFGTLALPLSLSAKLTGPFLRAGGSLRYAFLRSNGAKTSCAHTPAFHIQFNYCEIFWNEGFWRLLTMRSIEKFVVKPGSFRQQKSLEFKLQLFLL